MDSLLDKYNINNVNIKAKIKKETIETVITTFYQDENLQIIIFLGVFLFIIFSIIGFLGRLMTIITTSIINVRENCILEFIGMTKSQFFIRFMLEEFYFLVTVAFLTIVGINGINYILNSIYYTTGIQKYWGGFILNPLFLLVFFCGFYLIELSLSFLFFLKTIKTGKAETLNIN